MGGYGININKDTLIKIVKLGRPQFTFGVLLYFLIGTFFAVLLNGQFVLYKVIWGFLILFTANLATHYSNDYFDFDVDKYGTVTPFSGGSGILVKNPELKRVIKKISLLFHGLVHFNWSRFYHLLFLSYFVLCVCIIWKCIGMVLFSSPNKISL